jgi:predicted acetyltransferase
MLASNKVFGIARYIYNGVIYSVLQQLYNIHDQLPVVFIIYRNTQSLGDFYRRVGGRRV